MSGREGAHGSPPHPMRIFAAFLARDIRVVSRELPFFLIRTALQPVLMLAVFGFLLPRMGAVPRGYAITLLPGVYALSLTLAALQAVALPMIVDFGYGKEIEDRLLAPAPIRLIAIEKIVSGTLQGCLSAGVVLPVARLVMGPIPSLSAAHVGLVLVVTILGGVVFSSLGLWMGTAFPPQQIGLMFSVILAPMIFFGCAYYPWQGLTSLPAMKYGVLVNPLVYVAEGLRASLTPGVPHMPVTGVLAALVVVAAFLARVGLAAFERKAMS